jgi:hypothetical protein
MPSVTGIIKHRQFDSDQDGHYSLTYALWLPNRLLVSIVHTFTEEERDVWLNYRDSLDAGMTVEMCVDAVPTPDRRSYAGQGAIRLMDDGLESPWFPVAEEVFSSNPADSRKFSRSEQGQIWALLNEAKETLREQFDPDDEQAESIDQRLDALAADLPKVSVFSWKKLFVECVVGISVDLGFGSTVPETLINLFKKLFEAYLSHTLTNRA